MYVNECVSQLPFLALYVLKKKKECLELERRVCKNTVKSMFV